MNAVLFVSDRCSKVDKIVRFGRFCGVFLSMGWRIGDGRSCSPEMHLPSFVPYAAASEIEDRGRNEVDPFDFAQDGWLIGKGSEGDVSCPPSPWRAEPDG